jgi:hypothetical protein
MFLPNDKVNLTYAQLQEILGEMNDKVIECDCGNEFTGTIDINETMRVVENQSLINGG